MSYTPGPWTAERGNVGASHPLFVVAPDMDGFRAWTDDDARLIAASPDLLEACKTASKYIGSLKGDIHRHSTAWRELSAAIAKAEGR